MMITKIALPRRTFLRGLGAAFALPMLDAMVPALSAAQRSAANPVRRLGFIYVPERRGDERQPQLLDAERDRHELRALADSRAAGAVSGSIDDRQRSRPEAGGIARGRKRRAHAGVRIVAEWHPSEEDGRRGPQAGNDGRSDRGRAVRKGHRAAVDGDDLVGDRSRPRRPMRSRLQLRLHEHGVVAVAHDSPAGREQSQCRVRAAVRRGRDAGRASRPDEEEAEPSRSRQPGSRRACSNRSAPAIGRVLPNISTPCARWSGAFRPRKNRTRTRRCPCRIVRSAFRRGTTIISSCCTTSSGWRIRAISPASSVSCMDAS